MESKIQQIMEKIVIIELRDNFELVLEAKPEELNKYELSNFVKAVLKEDEEVDRGFVAELIASYDQKKQVAKVRGRTLKVNKGALTAALHLPGTNGDDDEDEEDATAVDFSDEAGKNACFLYNFVMGCMYLNSEQEIVAKVHKMSHCIMRGHPEVFDFSGFMWLLVENEIIKGTDIEDCYYAPHMQCLIRDQLSDLFVVAPDDGDGDDTRSAPMESEISGQIKKVYQRRRRNNYKGGTASGSGSRGQDVNSGSPSSASSTSRGHDVNPGSPSCASSTSETF